MVAGLILTVVIAFLAGAMAEGLGASDSGAGTVALCAAGIAFCLFVGMARIVRVRCNDLRDELALREARREVRQAEELNRKEASCATV